MDIKTKDGGVVQLEDGLWQQFSITVTSLDRDTQEPTTASVQLSNSQGFDLAMELLSRLEVNV